MLPAVLNCGSGCPGVRHADQSCASGLVAAELFSSPPPHRAPFTAGKSKKSMTGAKGATLQPLWLKHSSRDEPSMHDFSAKARCVQLSSLSHQPPPWKCQAHFVRLAELEDVLLCTQILRRRAHACMRARPSSIRSASDACTMDSSQLQPAGNIHDNAKSIILYIKNAKALAADRMYCTK